MTYLYSFYSKKNKLMDENVMLILRKKNVFKLAIAPDLNVAYSDILKGNGQWPINQIK